MAVDLGLDLGEDVVPEVHRGHRERRFRRRRRTGRQAKTITKSFKRTYERRPRPQPQSPAEKRRFAQRFQHLWKSGPFRARGRPAGSVAGTGLKLSHARAAETRFKTASAQAPGFDSRRTPSVDSRFCPVEAARRGRSRPPGGRQHEADLPAEQPQAEEDPRLPGPHADQGRPPGAEAAPAEGPQADRGLSRRVPAARARRASARASGCARGRSSGACFATGLRLDGPLFLLVAVENGSGYGRLGLARVAPAGRRGRAQPRQAAAARELPAAQASRPALDLVLDPQARDPGAHPGRGGA